MPEMTMELSPRPVASPLENQPCSMISLLWDDVRVQGELSKQQSNGNHLLRLRSGMNDLCIHTTIQQLENLHALLGSYLQDISVAKGEKV